MAASPFTLFSNAVLGMSKGQFNLSTDAYVATLHTNTYVPAPNTDTVWGMVGTAGTPANTELATGLGYTAGGVLLAGETDTLATATVTFTANSPSWATFSAGPFRYVLITRRAVATLASTDLLLCYSDLTGTGTISGTGGSFTITISGSGIFTLAHTP